MELSRAVGTQPGEVPLAKSSRRLPCAHCAMPSSPTVLRESPFIDNLLMNSNWRKRVRQHNVV